MLIQVFSSYNIDVELLGPDENSARILTEIIMSIIMAKLIAMIGFDSIQD